MEHIHLLSSVDHRNRWTIYTTARWTNSRRLFSQASVLESRWISKKQRTLRSRIPQHHLKSHDINPMKSHEIPWNPMKSYHQESSENPIEIPCTRPPGTSSARPQSTQISRPWWEAAWKQWPGPPEWKKCCSPIEATDRTMGCERMKKWDFFTYMECS